MSSINRPISAHSDRSGLPREEIIDANVRENVVTIGVELRVPAECINADIQDTVGSVHSPRGSG